MSFANQNVFSPFFPKGERKKIKFSVNSLLSPPSESMSSGSISNFLFDKDSKYFFYPNVIRYEKIDR